jgi:hypothetical protein
MNLSGSPRARFSRKTIIAALEVLERMAQAEFTRFLLKLDSDLIKWIPDESRDLKTRVNRFIVIYDQDPDRQADGGELVSNVVVEAAVFQLPPAPRPWSAPRPEPEDIVAFRRALELDGFTIADGSLRRTLPSDVGLVTAEDEITHLLEKHSFVTAAGHLKQALNAHVRGHWAAANSQIRSFFDGTVDAIAEKLDPASAALATGQPRREKLAALGFLSVSLNEWDSAGKGFINGLTKRLHPHGAHPGLSDEEDSTFRLHTVLLTARFLLARFDVLSSKP